MKCQTSETAFLILIGFIFFTIGGCSQRSASLDPASADASAHPKARVSALKCIQQGIASWYGTGLKGQKTASGEKYDPKLLTAASRKYPMGTELNVVNLKNDRDVTVTINDRGPYVGKRVIDLSEAAADELGMKKAGLATVCVLNAQQTEAKTNSGAP